MSGYRHGRFNEAAGVPRGILLIRERRPATAGRGFNEAAGVPRGILWSVLR